MSFTRRQFLLTTSGAGIGFILPSFYDKALTLWENHEEVLILPNKDAHTVMYVHGEYDLELNLGRTSAIAVFWRSISNPNSTKTRTRRRSSTPRSSATTGRSPRSPSGG